MTSTCLITGGSGGIARALAATLRAQGWRVARAGRAVEKLAPDDGDVLLEANVATEAGAAKAVAEATAAFGAVPDAVVNAAGAILLAGITRTSEAQYRDCLAANLDTAFFTAKAYVAALQQAQKDGGSGAGRLLMFSSVAAGIGVGNHAAIAMAKGAIEALVRSLAADHSAMGLRVNAIASGLMATPLTAKLVANEASKKAISAQYPLGRHGEAEDAAALAAFLVGPGGDWINGQVIALDGGFTAVRPMVKVAG
ncbi:MAG: SDR family oxidoreductase [Xanthomonadaceae bacterium]|jgi:NAD(P)-dependent dehydrogenase (short-subunit alcohol dehydrogenase family)|nr:SDR family oxidoreductase [Xanthomonadaceae bacterium]MCZ8317433.1 SDR family oxidoreductase [Silanimonas sp.]